LAASFNRHRAGLPSLVRWTKKRPQRGLRIEAVLFLDTAGRLRHPVARRSYFAMLRCSILTTRPAGFR